MLGFITHKQKNCKNLERNYFWGPVERLLAVKKNAIKI